MSRVDRSVTKGDEEVRYSPIDSMRGGLHLLGQVFPEDVYSDSRISVVSIPTFSVQ